MRLCPPVTCSRCAARRRIWELCGRGAGEKRFRLVSSRRWGEKGFHIVVAKTSMGVWNDSVCTSVICIVAWGGKKWNAIIKQATWVLFQEHSHVTRLVDSVLEVVREFHESNQPSKRRFTPEWQRHRSLPTNQPQLLLCNSWTCSDLWTWTLKPGLNFTEIYGQVPRENVACRAKHLDIMHCKQAEQLLLARCMWDWEDWERWWAAVLRWPQILFFFLSFLSFCWESEI